MRLASLTRKILIENLRDWKILILTLTFAPLFVLLMYFYSAETGQRTYRIAVINQDAGLAIPNQPEFNAGADLIDAMVGLIGAEGEQILEVTEEGDLNTAKGSLMLNKMDLVVVIPGEFSEILLKFSEGEQPDPVILQTYGDPSKANYIMAAVWSDMTAYEYAAAIAGIDTPIEIQVNSVLGERELNEFELYVPALLALALMMLMFQAAASLIKEKDEGTIIRLRLSNMRTHEWLLAVTIIQVLIGILALALTYGFAVALGYESSGSVGVMLFVGFLASLSIIAISLIVSAYLRTIFDLMTIGCFPFFILMFFSGGMFPLPPLRLVTIGERVLHINDILPTTHAINAMSRILNYGAGWGDIGYEVAAISILTLLYFAIGVRVFIRRHMRAIG